MLFVWIVDLMGVVVMDVFAEGFVDNYFCYVPLHSIPYISFDGHLSSTLSFFFNSHCSNLLFFFGLSGSLLLRGEGGCTSL